MTETHRLTDLIQQLKQVRETEGDLLIGRPTIMVHDENLDKLLSIGMDGTETLYES